MVSRVHNVTFGSRNSYELSKWWEQVLTYAEDADDPNLPEHDENGLRAPNGGPNILFVDWDDVPQKEGTNRLHLDIVPEDRTRDEEVERLLALGATLVADHRRPDGTGWAVMADPEGNEFCVERSDAERAER